MIAHLPQEQSDADEVIKMIESAGRRVLDVPDNLTKERACQELIAKTVEMFDRVDNLTVVASEQTIESLDQITSEYFDSVMKTNV